MCDLSFLLLGFNFHARTYAFGILTGRMLPKQAVMAYAYIWLTFGFQSSHLLHLAQFFCESRDMGSPIRNRRNVYAMSVNP